MATGPIGQSQITNALRVMMAEANRFGEHKGVYKGTVELHELPRKMGRDWNRPSLPPLTAVAVAADNEYDSPQQVADQKVTITPGEVIVQVEYGLRAFATSTLNAGMLGELTADAIEVKRDVDGLAVYDTFGGVIGTTSTTLTVDLIAKAATNVKAGRATNGASARTGARTTGEANFGEMFAVFHEYNFFDIQSQLSGLGGAPTQVTTGAAAMNYAGNTISEYMKSWIEQGSFVGKIAGTTVLVDNNFTIASNAIKGGVYGRKSLLHITFDDYDLKDPWYSKDRRFVTLTAVADYGNGKQMDVGGREVDVDATAPS